MIDKMYRDFLENHSFTSKSQQPGDIDLNQIKLFLEEINKKNEDKTVKCFKIVDQYLLLCSKEELESLIPILASIRKHGGFLK